MPELWDQNFSRSDLLRRLGRLEQAAGVRLVTLGDGVERGVRVLEFRAGNGFAFDVIVDRAFDIGRCEYQGMPISWQSNTGFAGPWFAEHEELGFFRTFGAGLLTTCGLEHTLFMAEDTAEQYHYPAKKTETFGLHGRISNRPARLTGYGERWEGDTCILWAQGETIQATVFGEQLMLRRRIEARVGESRILLHDEVENLGYDPTPHMFLYHINLGFPLVDEGSELLLPSNTIIPRGDYPIEGMARLTAPTSAFVEQVFEYETSADSTGSVPVALVNHQREIGFYELFKQDQFPHALVWRMLGEGTYVVGLEPGTNRAAGRMDARQRNELITLAPGEIRSYDLEMGLLQDRDKINTFTARIYSARL